MLVLKNNNKISFVLTMRRERRSIQYSSYFVVLQNAWENCKIPFKNFFYNAKHVHMCVTFWHFGRVCSALKFEYNFQITSEQSGTCSGYRGTWENSKLRYYFQFYLKRVKTQNCIYHEKILSGTNSGMNQTFTYYLTEREKSSL